MRFESIRVLTTLPLSSKRSITVLLREKNIVTPLEEDSIFLLGDKNVVSPLKEEFNEQCVILWLYLPHDNRIYHKTIKLCMQ